MLLVRCRISILNALGCGLHGSHEEPCILVRQRRPASFAVRDQDRVSSEVIRQRPLDNAMTRRRRSRGGGCVGRREQGQRPQASRHRESNEPNPRVLERGRTLKRELPMASSFATREASGCSRPCSAGRAHVCEWCRSSEHRSCGCTRAQAGEGRQQATLPATTFPRDFECGMCYVRGDVSE